MDAPIEISDDDDSFESSALKQNEGESKNITIDFSSDDTVNYYTSDDEALPVVNVKRRAAIEKVFPAKLQPSCSKQSKSVEFFSNLTKNSNLASKCLPVNEPRVEKMIGGVKVVLPVEPYGCQTALMYKIITALNTCQNCLLESPTGSGKTLALLCGALSWLQHEKNRLASLQAQGLMQLHPEFEQVDKAADYIASPQKIDYENFFDTNRFDTGERSIYDKPNQNNGDPHSSKRSEPMQERFGDESPPHGEVKIHKKRKLDSTPERPTKSLPTTPEKPIQVKQPETPEAVSVPTIYYGARTHKQLQQVIKEFSRIAYCRDFKMTVLSSRDYSCIREFDRNLWGNKNDMCRGCIKKDLTQAQKENMQKNNSETNCKYYNNKEAIDHKVLPDAFDLEDLVSVGHEKMACPYYAAREMAKSAHIVFCPYNYLIEPGIRSSMGISLENNIVIVDEAHNIEDICRDAATFNFTWDTVQACILELETCTSYRFANTDAMHYLEYLLNALKNWDQWFKNQQPLVNSKPLNNNEAVYPWEIPEFLQTLHNHNIGDKQFKEFSQAVEVFIRKFRDSPGTLYGVTQATGTLVESLEIVLGYLFRENGRFKDDFKPILVRTVAGNGDASDSHRWRSSQFNKWIDKDSLTLRLLCLNPAVVFCQLHSARSVILASGTLTPMGSLYSELGSLFPLKISPNHVISPNRVWIGSVTTCPDGSKLDCTSKGTNTSAIQDALGDIVRWVAKVTPNGVLCFLPSYMLMNKLAKRWEETGLMDELNGLKHVFMESRNAKDHNEVMEVVSGSTDIRNLWAANALPSPHNKISASGVAIAVSSVTFHTGTQQREHAASTKGKDYYKYVCTSKGALLFAVYRGKVSEGMDFKDHQARAVVTIGVPFPNTFDIAVQEKMKYNEKFKSRGLLPKNEWLRVQAYRALNQAVGRCVRHRMDWGAVLLVDARYSIPHYTEHLSKWVLGFLGNNHHTYDSLVNSSNSLESFMQSMKIDDGEQV